MGAREPKAARAAAPVKAKAAKAAEPAPQRWVRFRRNRDWELGPKRDIAYLRGQEVELAASTVDKLVADGSAEEIAAPTPWEARCIRRNRNFRPDPMPREPKGWSPEG